MDRSELRLKIASMIASTGMSPSEVSKCIEKEAGPLADVWKAMSGTAKTLATSALIGAPLAGGLVGYGMGAAARPGVADLKSMRDMAVLKDYMTAIDTLEKRKQEEQNKRQARGDVLLGEKSSAMSESAVPGPVTANIARAKVTTMAQGRPDLATNVAKKPGMNAINKYLLAPATGKKNVGGMFGFNIPGGLK